MSGKFEEWANNQIGLVGYITPETAWHTSRRDALMEAYSLLERAEVDDAMDEILRLAEMAPNVQIEGLAAPEVGQRLES
jgi:hypothetical protein